LTRDSQERCNDELDENCLFQSPLKGSSTTWYGH
jgi:hypothetical protein